jgi:serine phosphatase RsbU (regulator of sigma subunit)
MRYFVLLFLLGLAVAHFSVLIWQQHYAEQQYIALEDDIAHLDKALEAETTLSQEIGALQLLGLSDPTVKAQALGLLTDNDAEALKDLSIIQQFYHVDGVYILNKDGKVVAHQTKEKSSLGKFLPWRPYFQQAMKGIANVYPAVGSVSGERGLYFAVPIYESNYTDSSIIGVLMLKKIADGIDALLTYHKGNTLLLSPQGVVFSSNHQDWLYHVMPPISELALADIIKQKQFGKTFEGAQAQIPLLPFSWKSHQKRLDVVGKDYVIADTSVDWSDPLGAWQLIVMRPATLVLTGTQLFLIYLGIASFVVILGLFILWQRHQWLARQQAKAEIKQSHQRIKESIEYAALIQHALIPDDALFAQAFRDHFTFWLPKDVVGGDVYFLTRVGQRDDWLLIVVDCTGHGVPGAFVTMLVKAIEQHLITSLQLKQEAIHPAQILSLFNRTIKFVLKQDQHETLNDVGFDGAVIYYQQQNQTLLFAGANTSLYQVSNGKLMTHKGNRHAIGYKNSESDYSFTEHSIQALEDNCFYVATDGYQDQIGGDKGFPFGKNKLAQLLTANAHLPMSEQKEKLIAALTEYRGIEPHNDDITVIGFRV